MNTPQKPTTRRILVWDIPTRILHWSLAGSFALAFAAAVIGEHSPIFKVHMLVGLIMGYVVLLRLIWGVVGTKHARLWNFIFSPLALAHYVRDVLSGRPGRKYAGHNPGSGYAAFAIWGMALLVVATGLWSGEDLHEAVSYGMLAVVGAHLVGIILHTIRHRENVAFSMIDGKKDGDPSAAIRTRRPLAGVLSVVLVVIGAGAILRSYDSGTNQVNLLGQKITLGEGEHEGSGGGGDRDRDGDDD